MEKNIPTIELVALDVLRLRKIKLQTELIKGMDFVKSKETELADLRLTINRIEGAIKILDEIIEQQTPNEEQV